MIAGWNCRIAWLRGPLAIKFDHLFWRVTEQFPVFTLLKKLSLGDALKDHFHLVQEYLKTPKMYCKKIIKISEDHTSLTNLFSFQSKGKTKTKIMVLL